MSQIAAADSAKVDAGLIKIVIGAALTGMMSSLDSTVVNVAQRTFITNFHTSAATAAWVITAYTLALAAIIPISGWAVDKIGIKRWFLTSILVFMTGSIICAFAQSILQLIIFRVIQGIGGGMLLPASTILVTKAAGPKRLTQVMPFLGIPILLGPIIGPIIGGQLLDHLSWHWIFLINLPIGLISFIYAIIVLPADNKNGKSEQNGQRLDLIGLLLLSPGLASLLYGISSLADTDNLLAKKIIYPITIGIILISLFAFNSFKSSYPLVNLRIFKNKLYLTSVICVFTFICGLFGTFILLPLYYMMIRGESAAKTGVLLTPNGIAAMITIMICGKLAPIYGSKPFVLGGSLLYITGFIPMLFIKPDTPYWYLIIATFVQGLGAGMVMMQLFATALSTLSGPEVSRGTTVTNITQQIAMATGTAIMPMLWTKFLPNKSLFYFLTAIDPKLVPKDKLASFLQAKSQQTILATNSMQTAFITTIVLVASTFIIAAFFLPNSTEEKNSSNNEAMLI